MSNYHLGLGTNRDATLRYLQELYGECSPHHGGIVLVDQSKKKPIALFDTYNLWMLAAAIQANENCYIKVNLMDTAKMEERRRQAIEESRFCTPVGNREEVKTIIGFFLDADAGKSSKYHGRNEVLNAFWKMPVPPSLIVDTDGRQGGFHPYWLFEKPHRIIDAADREKWSAIARRWQEKLKSLLGGKLDSTANIDRVLRPVGSMRSNGNRVELYYTSGRRYTEKDFYIPPTDEELRENAKREVRKMFEDILGPVEQSDKPIQVYIDAARITPETLLSELGYQQLRNPDEWMRPDSSTKSRSVLIGNELDRPGINVFSGGDPRFSCLQKNGSVGKFYSVDEMFVIIRHRGDWKAAAKWCHEQIARKLPKVNLEAILA